MEKHTRDIGCGGGGDGGSFAGILRAEKSGHSGCMTQKHSKQTSQDFCADDAGVKMWPSERIPQGGLFHAPKFEYSKETADLIKLLMKESRMSMTMRKQVENSLRNGEPLPKPAPPRINTLGDPDANTMEILRRARNAKRKSLAKIVASGALEPPQYRPPVDNRRLPSDKDKKLLQEAMCGFRLPDTNMKPKRRRAADLNEETSTPEEIINELFNQIHERADWLAEMEELGEGKKYRDEIREQIAQRLRQIKALETKIAIQKQGLRFIE